MVKGKHCIRFVKEKVHLIPPVTGVIFEFSYSEQISICYQLRMICILPNIVGGSRCEVIANNDEYWLDFFRNWHLITLSAFWCILYVIVSKVLEFYINLRELR